jgi:hypothetical protein
VAKVDIPHTQELGRQLEALDFRLRMETVFVELEENQKVLERLEIKSPAKGKSGAANSSDKKSAKQMVANPAIQQPFSCPVCGLNHDILQCKKEELECMQKLRNEENFLVRTSQLVGILRDRNKNVKIGLMNIMLLVRDVSCVSL